ncbi:unnamed protein product [Closterium sp. NIES-53]
MSGYVVSDVTPTGSFAVTNTAVESANGRTTIKFERSMRDGEFPMSSGGSDDGGATGSTFENSQKRSMRDGHFPMSFGGSDGSGATGSSSRSSGLTFESTQKFERSMGDGEFPMSFDGSDGGGATGSSSSSGGGGNGSTSSSRSRSSSSSNGGGGGGSGSSSTILWAYSRDNSQWLADHGPNAGSARVNFFIGASEVGKSSSGNATLYTIHAWLLAPAFGVLMPSAILISRLFLADKPLFMLATTPGLASNTAASDSPAAATFETSQNIAASNSSAEATATGAAGGLGEKPKLGGRHSGVEAAEGEGKPPGRLAAVFAPAVASASLARPPAAASSGATVGAAEGEGKLPICLAAEGAPVSETPQKLMAVAAPAVASASLAWPPAVASGATAGEETGEEGGRRGIGVASATRASGAGGSGAEGRVVSRKRWVSKPFAFRLHRWLVLLAVILALTGIIMAFVEKGLQSLHSTHGRLGLVIMGLIVAHHSGPSGFLLHAFQE